MKKVRLILGVVMVLGIAAAAASVAVAKSTSVDRQALSCKRIVLGSMGPYTGPVASIGTDQLHCVAVLRPALEPHPQDEGRPGTGRPPARSVEGVGDRPAVRVEQLTRWSR